MNFNLCLHGVLGFWGFGVLQVGRAGHDVRGGADCAIV